MAFLKLEKERPVSWFMHPLIDYIKTPVWIESAPLERVALNLMLPARFIAQQFTQEPFYLWRIDPKKAPKVLLIQSLSLPSFASLHLLEKIKRLFLLATAALLAIPLTPLAWALHRLALLREEEVNASFAQIEKWEKSPLLIMALKGELELLLDAAKSGDEEKLAHFFKEDRAHFAVLNLLLSDCDRLQKDKKSVFQELLKELIRSCPPKYLDKLYGPMDNKGGEASQSLLEIASKNGWHEIVLALIKDCPQERKSSWFSPSFLEKGETLLSQAIRKGDRALALLLLASQESFELVFQPSNGAESLLDLALSSRPIQLEIAEQLVYRYPEDRLAELLSEKSQPARWPLSLCHIFKEKVTAALRANHALVLAPLMQRGVLKQAVSCSWLDVLKVWVEVAPQDSLESALALPFLGKDETLTTFAVCSGHSELLATLFTQYVQKEDFFKFTKEGKSLLDLALNSKPPQIEIAAQLFCFCPKDHLSLLFSEKTNPKKWPEHFRSFMSEELQELSKTAPELLKQSLTNRQSDGDTLLHHPDLLHFFAEYLERLSIDLSQVYNRGGVTPLQLKAATLNSSWLNRLKQVEKLEVLSFEAYKRRAQDLKKRTFALWDALQFGEGEGKISEILLEMGPQRRQNKENVSALLRVMLDKIEGLVPWIGTPKADDHKGLLVFYSEMLFHFEEVIAYLESQKNPMKTAGYLVSVAKVEYEGRCAAAYQSEIKQTNQSCRLDRLGKTSCGEIEQAAVVALQELVEECLRSQKGGNDVHKVSRLEYACGLAPNPDPLDQKYPGFEGRLESARRCVCALFNSRLFLKKVASLLDKESVLDQFKALTPNVQPYSFVESFFLLCQEATRSVVKNMSGRIIFEPKTEELYRKIIIELRAKENNLKTKTLSEICSISDKICKSDAEKIFFSIQAAGSVAFPNLLEGENLIEKIIAQANEKLCKACSFEALDITAFSVEGKEFEDKLIAFLKKENKWNPKMRGNIHQIHSELKRQLRKGREFRLSVVKYTQTRGATARIAQIHKNYQSALTQLLKETQEKYENEELDFAFDRESYLYPSEAIENNYKIWKASFDIDHQEKRVLFLLHHHGIFSTVNPL